MSPNNKNAAALIETNESIGDRALVTRGPAPAHPIRCRSPTTNRPVWRSEELTPKPALLHPREHRFAGTSSARSACPLCSICPWLAPAAPAAAAGTELQLTAATRIASGQIAVTEKSPRLSRGPNEIRVRCGTTTTGHYAAVGMSEGELSTEAGDSPPGAGPTGIDRTLKTNSEYYAAGPWEIARRSEDAL